MGKAAADLFQVVFRTRGSDRVEPNGVWAYVTLSVCGVSLLVAGWLLPWFVEPTANGIGFSPQDVVLSTPSGVAWVAICLVGLAWLGLALGLVVDLTALRSGRRASVARWWRVRTAAALTGAVCVLLVWVVVGALRAEMPFGPLSAFAVTNSAVWMSLTGFLLCAVATGATPAVTRWPTHFLVPVAFAIGGLFPLIFGQSQEFIQFGAGAAAIYILLAIGLNVVVGYAGLLDLGYAAFFAIGAYTCGSLASPRHGIHLPFWILIFIGAAVAAVFGVLIGAPTLRLRGDYLAIVTLGFGEIIPNAANNNLFSQTGGPNGISDIDHPSIAGLNFGLNPSLYFWSLLVVIAAVIVLLYNLQRSRLGRAWGAVREDELAAVASGINPVTTKLLAFAIGATVSGLAGAFYGAEIGVVTPEDFAFAVSVTALSAVVLGGLGSIGGAALGGLLVSFVIFWILPHLQEWQGTLAGTTGATWLSSIDIGSYIYVIYGAILLLVMLVRPGGLLPNRARRIEMREGVREEALADVRGES